MSDRKGNSPPLQIVSAPASKPGSALEAAMSAGRSSTELALRSETKPSLQDWNPDGITPPPVTEAEALDAAQFGEFERRIDASSAVSIAQRIAASYPYLSRNNADDDALATYIADLSEIIARHHPKVVEEVTAGPNRIQLQSKFAPTAVELKEAMNRAAFSRFKLVQRARLALAYYAAAERCPDIRYTDDWRLAFRIKNGDRALALVREQVEAS